MNLKLTAILYALGIIQTNAGVPFGSDRRQLIETGVTELNDCKEEMYQISVKAGGSSGAHFSGVAKPQCNELKEESCECPILSFDSVNDNDDNLVNIVHILTEDSDSKDSLILGLFPLNVILNAFTTASVRNSGTQYNFFDNNCASFLINMGLELDLNLGDKKFTSFIAQQISSEFVMDNLLATGAETIHTNLFDGNNEDIVIEEFISNYIKQRI